MKCIKTNDGKISRVTEQEAEKQVQSGKAVYIPKSEWKTHARNEEK